MTYSATNKFVINVIIVKTFCIFIDLYTQEGILKLIVFCFFLEI